MPRLKIETIGSGDQSWLGSAHGIRNCRTETLDPAGFTKATHYPNDYFPSGLPVAKVGGFLVAYNSAATTGAQILAGFLFTDQATDGATKIPAPVLDHGRVKVAKVAAVQSGFVAPSDANDATTVVYI